MPYNDFFPQGIAVLMIGPTLIDLSNGINASIEAINIIYPVGAVGYCVGCILGKHLLGMKASEIAPIYSSSSPFQSWWSL